MYADCSLLVHIQHSYAGMGKYICRNLWIIQRFSDRTVIFNSLNFTFIGDLLHTFLFQHTFLFKMQIFVMVERKHYTFRQPKVCKSHGPDNLPNWILHDFSVWLAEPVCAIYTTSLQQGVFHSFWKKSNVIPVPKKNPLKFIDSDTRLILLTST